MTDIDGDDDYIDDTELKSKEILFMNPLAEIALKYGSIEKFKTGCEYADVSEAEANRFYQAGVTCYEKVGVSNAERDGIYATAGGMIINDGRQTSAIIEDFLCVGLAVVVKCPYDPETKRIVYNTEKQTVEPYGSLWLDPYALLYAMASLPDDE